MEKEKVKDIISALSIASHGKLLQLASTGQCAIYSYETISKTDSKDYPYCQNVSGALYVHFRSFEDVILYHKGGAKVKAEVLQRCKIEEEPKEETSEEKAGRYYLDKLLVEKRGIIDLIPTLSTMDFNDVLWGFDTNPNEGDYYMETESNKERAVISLFVYMPMEIIEAINWGTINEGFKTLVKENYLTDVTVSPTDGHILVFNLAKG